MFPLKAELGVPVMTPPLDRDNPAGRRLADEGEIDQVIGVAPVAVNVVDGYAVPM
jgi:hypothetical protein